VTLYFISSSFSTAIQNFSLRSCLLNTSLHKSPKPYLLLKARKKLPFPSTIQKG